VLRRYYGGTTVKAPLGAELEAPKLDGLTRTGKRIRPERGLSSAAAVQGSWTFKVDKALR
jgi:hypothetical protein